MPFYTCKGGGDSILNVGQKWRHTWEDSIYPRPSLWITYMYTTAKLFPHLALSGQCIVDCQQCTVGSSPVVGLRRLHVSVDHDVGWCRGLSVKHVAAVEDLHAAAPQLRCCSATRGSCVGNWSCCVRHFTIKESSEQTRLCIMYFFAFWKL